MPGRSVSGLIQQLLRSAMVLQGSPGITPGSSPARITLWKPKLNVNMKTHNRTNIAAFFRIMISPPFI
jgi:hypothetical protein